MIDVVLTINEAKLAASVGMHRHMEAISHGLPDKHGFTAEDGWTIHIQGAAGEIAAAKALNRYWNGSVNTFKRGGDVGKLQVRTRSRMDYDLIVRPDDRDSDVFILVLGGIPSFRVAGWILGSDAKCEAWLQTHGNRPAAYFVPQESLHRIRRDK